MINNNNHSSSNESKAGIWTEDRKQQTIDWAIRLYDRIISLDPADVSFMLLRSFCFSESGSFEPALTDAVHVIDHWPDRADGYFVKEKALAGLRKYLEADEAQKRVNELQSGGSDSLADVLKQQIARHWLIWTACKDLESGSSDAGKAGNTVGHGEEKKSSKKQSKQTPKDEKKRSEKRRSPVDEQSVSISSRPVAAASSKMIESKVTKVEKVLPAPRRRSKSPVSRKHPKEETNERLDDSAGDNFEVVDDISYPQYDQDLNIETAFTPPPQPRPRSPHSPEEPVVTEDRRGSHRNRDNSYRLYASPTDHRKAAPAFPARDRKPVRIDRSRSRSPGMRRANSHSPVHHNNRRTFDKAGNAGRRSRSRSRSLPHARVSHRDLPVNIYRFTAIRIRNIYPHINQKLLESVASKYGRVVNIETKDKEAIITYNDTESPRRAIADLHDTFVHRVSHFSDKLHVRFALGSNQDKFHMRNVKRIECDECHFYRTTGCEEEKCPEKHVMFNAGIDLQPWMGKPRPGGSSNPPFRI